MEEDLLRLRHRTIGWTLLVNIILFCLTYFVFPSIAWGFIFGMCFGLIAFNLKAGRLLKQAGQGIAPKPAMQFMNSLLRYFVFAVAIFLALQYNELNIIATMAGLLSVNLVMIILSVMEQ
ncbi:MAG: ATP synthase subunit I [Candidatus Margulisiibacteriota bacterium]|jgi:hypothetical protein